MRLPRAQVPANFLNSAEMYRRLVDEYYTKLLGRAADPAGAAAWLDLLQTGRATPTTVAVSILASQEYLTRTQR